MGSDVANVRGYAPIWPESGWIGSPKAVGSVIGNAGLNRMRDTEAVEEEITSRAIAAADHLCVPTNTVDGMRAL
jgi:hypothetical protein